MAQPCAAQPCAIRSPSSYVPMRPSAAHARRIPNLFCQGQSRRLPAYYTSLLSIPTLPRHQHSSVRYVTPIMISRPRPIARLCGHNGTQAASFRGQLSIDSRCGVSGLDPSRISNLEPKFQPTICRLQQQLISLQSSKRCAMARKSALAHLQSRGWNPSWIKISPDSFNTILLTTTPQFAVDFARLRPVTSPGHFTLLPKPRVLI